MSASLQYAVIVIALIGFWAIVVRPARRSQQRAADFQHDLAVGDDVIIASGIYGTVRSLEDGTVRLEIAPDTVITVARQAVVGRVPEPEDHSSSDSEN